MGKEAEMGKGRLGAATQAPWGFPEPEWSFRVTWSWTEMAEPLYSNMDQPLDVSCPGKWCDLGQRGFLQFRQSSKGLALKDRLLIALPQAGATSSPWRGVWHITASAILPQGDCKTTALKGTHLSRDQHPQHFLWSLLLKLSWKEQWRFMP